MKINLRILSITVAICLAMLGSIQIADPESLGITPVANRWLGIFGIGLGVLAGFLPKVTGPTTDPDTLIDRIQKLPVEEQIYIATKLADGAARPTSSPKLPGPPQ